jgi:protoheme IX farnesyltransferase
MGSLPSLKDLLGLCKIKVVMLILLTAVVGMLLAVPYVPSLLLIIAASGRNFIGRNVCSCIQSCC